MKTVFALLACVLVIASCTPKALFSEEARVKLAEQKVELARIQFYNDKEIVLRRKMTSEDVKVEVGVIKEVDGRTVQEVRIPRFTPCVVDSFSNGRLFVRFESGDDKYLLFYKNSYNKYQVDAQKWISGKGRVDYGGKTFFIETAGNDALLMVKKTKEYKSITESSRATGVKIDK